MGKVDFIIFGELVLLLYIPLKVLEIMLCYFSYLARPLEEVREASQEERDRAFEAALELQSKLESGSPSFIKSMVRSHVYSSFWLVCGNGGSFWSSYLSYA